MYTKTTLTEDDKKMVVTEIHQFMDSLDAAFKSVSPDKVFNYFFQTDELTVATQGNITTNPSALLDTMKVHMAFMEEQVANTVIEKIFVINKDAVVVSTS